MKAQKHQLVMIKGTKDGLSLFMDDMCSYSQLLSELETMLSARQYVQENGPATGVIVKAGNRFLTVEQEEEITAAISKNKSLAVEKIESNVLTKSEAQQLAAEKNIHTEVRMVRSGQVLKTEGDLLLIGDVNPGASVAAGGNIYILGSLKGMAHAGINGNREAVIAASKMVPAQLRIAEEWNTAPEHPESSESEMECAYIDGEGRIKIDRLQQLSHIRPNLYRL
ncbi:septum site-determining protein MinC [Metabacillus sp. GX 13764]|uniref:septum site-determining protein MinC n=1 Tax=Metabacillus kandeliae TaxID=2900151 RepID=UPI001E4BB5C8|nr:septum site-determining protein MinC [Metabacillus kandeliae]MCD7032926.1 septum site-determining protein MinC [Metabacillus kandeliae]